MADFKLEIIVEALTQQLDAALANVEKKLNDSASKADQLSKKVGKINPPAKSSTKSMVGLGVAVAKIGVVTKVAEAAIG